MKTKVLAGVAIAAVWRYAAIVESGWFHCGANGNQCSPNFHCACGPSQNAANGTLDVSIGIVSERYLCVFLSGLALFVSNG